MTDNPTLDPSEHSKQLIQETIRPELATWLDQHFNDTRDRTEDTTPPLVVTALPGGGRVTYPHVVLQETDDSAEAIDQRLAFNQHDFQLTAEIHGRSSTEMFNLRGLVRGYFLSNREALGGDGFAELDISGNPASWDATAKVVSWELTVSGLVHTHPDATSE